MLSKPVISVNEEQIAFFMAMGQAVSQWSFIEHGLFLVVSRCFDMDDFQPLANGFYSIENFRSKVSFVDRSFQVSRHVDGFGADWAKTKENVTKLAKSRNAIAHSRVMIHFRAPEGKRFAIVPTFAKPRGKRDNPDHPPPGSLCLRDIDLARLRFSQAHSQLMSLYLRMDGQEDLYAESALQESNPQTLAQLRHQIYSMLPSREESSPTKF